MQIIQTGFLHSLTLPLFFSSKEIRVGMEEKSQLKETLVESGKEREEEQSIRTASISSSIYNLINGILGSCHVFNSQSGSGILVLPMSVSKFGWLLGTVFLVLFACKRSGLASI